MMASTQQKIKDVAEELEQLVERLRGFDVEDDWQDDAGADLDEALEAAQQREVDLLEEVVEALVAAREGSQGAAVWAIQRIIEVHPHFAGDVGRFAMLAHIRPADYWSHA